jgi:DNA repair protein RadD
MQPTPENGLVVLPTGSGKSLVIADVVSRLDGPCVVFQPSKEILEQNFAKFVAYGYRPAIYSASVGQRRVGQITLATIGSVRTKTELFSD